MRDPFGWPRGPFPVRLGTPALDLNFLTGVMPSGLTYTRASTATYIGSDGLLKTAAVDEPRFDYDPITLACKGLLIEGARTNLLLNSATLATQSVTTAAQSYTLTFYGTGSVALSGAYTGSLAGTGASDRVKLTFTAAAGTLTLTVTGSVTQAQLEAGAYPSSYIPTTTAAVTRAPDTCLMTGTNFSRWFNPVEGTFLVEASSFGAGVTNGLLFAQKQNAAPRYQMTIGATGIVAAAVVNDASVAVAPGFGAGGGVPFGTVTRAALAYKTDDFACTRDGLTPGVDTSGDVPLSVNYLRIGEANNDRINGHIRRVPYWPRRLSNARLQELTA